MTRWLVTSTTTGASATVDAERAWEAHQRAALVGPDGVRLAFGQVRCRPLSERVERIVAASNALADIEPTPTASARRGSADDSPLVVSPPAPILNGKNGHPDAALARAILGLAVLTHVPETPPKRRRRG